MLYRYNSTIMWRQTDKIGCDYRTCSARLSNNLCQAPTTQPYLVICRYGARFIPNSPIDSNSDPFTPGDACTACPDGYECDDNLCKECPGLCPVTEATTTTTAAPTNPTSTKGPGFRFSKQDEQKILDLHNKLRGEIARGEMKTEANCEKWSLCASHGDGAANMRQLVNISQPYPM